MAPAQISIHNEIPEHFGPGEVVLRRGATPQAAVYLDSGCVVLGILGPQGGMEHHIATVQGPAWLDASAALLCVPSLVDGLAHTQVTLHRVVPAVLQQTDGAGRAIALDLLWDLARAHRQQTELAVSRVARDAVARCAQWLLQHAQTGASGACTVHLVQRKRHIAAQLGIAPETLSRALRHLREHRLISGTGRIVQLVDQGGLQMLSKP